MLQFPINWTMIWSDVHAVKYLQNSVWKLNDEWKMACLFIGNSKKPHCLEIRRVHTTGDVSVSGSLYLERPNDTRTQIGDGSMSMGNEMLPEHKFSKFMESGSSSVVVDFRDTTSGSSLSAYSLQGVVNITPVSALGKEECKKCANVKHLQELSKDLGRLLDPETCCFSDVNLKCRDESIPAHKNILSARSPVFAAMFKEPIKEGRENEVVIDDVDASALRKMLVFVYTGQLPDLTVSSASDLMKAADEYQIQDLTRRCCDLLREKINLQNALSLLALGESLRSDLKYFAMDYICNSCNNFSDLERTEDWKTMKKERPYLVMEILTSMVKAKEKK